MRCTYGLQTVAPFSHFQRFLECGYRAFVLRAFGQQTDRRHADLSLSAQGFLNFVQAFYVLQHNAVGERGFECIKLLGAGAAGISRVFISCRLALVRFFQRFLGFAELLGEFTHLSHQVFFRRVIQISQGGCGHQANPQEDFQYQT